MTDLFAAALLFIIFLHSSSDLREQEFQLTFMIDVDFFLEDFMGPYQTYFHKDG